MDNKLEDMLFDDSDLEDLFAEIEESNHDQQEIEDDEMAASQRRYMDIIKKHREDSDEEA